MRLAMESRAVIEQAKGVLMAQRGVDAEQAFEILRQASQRSNRKLRDVAAGIVATTTEGRVR
jgi:AmiR/NasT family two-component response regulator